MATSQPYTVACAGGLVKASNQIDLLKSPGVATELRNFEVSIKGGYSQCVLTVIVNLELEMRFK
jgi:hypothetical protein